MWRIKDLGVSIRQMVTEDRRAYRISQESKQNQRSSPRADPQGTLTFKGWIEEDDPAKKEQLDQNETRGNLKDKVVEETF